MERWGQTGNSLPLSSSSDEGYHHIGLGKPLCQPMHLFSVEPMRTALFDDTVSSDGGRGWGCLTKGLDSILLCWKTSTPK